MVYSWIYLKSGKKLGDINVNHCVTLLHRPFDIYLHGVMLCKLVDISPNELDVTHKPRLVKLKLFGDWVRKANHVRPIELPN
jgi:hypothetical protein